MQAFHTDWGGGPLPPPVTQYFWKACDGDCWKDHENHAWSWKASRIMKSHWDNACIANYGPTPVDS